MLLRNYLRVRDDLMADKITDNLIYLLHSFARDGKQLWHGDAIDPAVRDEIIRKMRDFSGQAAREIESLQHPDTTRNLDVINV